MKNFSEKIARYREVQNIARETMSHLRDFIEVGMTARDISLEAENFMKSLGVESFWYHDLGAFVFVGKMTTLSVSGRGYTVDNDLKVQENDLVTVDLSPCVGKIWGDFARSFVVNKGGIYLDKCLKFSESELFEGIIIEKKLHKKLEEMVSLEMTFGEVFEIMNAYIVEFGYKNLDFLGNLGHTIEEDKDERKYLEKDCGVKFSEIDFFTVPPDSKSYAFPRRDF